MLRTGATLPLIDLRDDYEIRTPRRGDDYAAQVWGRGGYWELGLFPSAVAARRAAHAFTAGDPVEPNGGAPRGELPPNWHRRRSDSHAPADNHRWVRQVKGGAWQARYWLEVVGGSLNLGLFTVSAHGDLAEWAAARASREFRKLWVGSTTVGEAVAILQAKRPEPWVPPGVVVPAKWRRLKLPTDYGETEFAHEKRARLARERERRRYRKGTLFGKLAAC